MPEEGVETVGSAYIYEGSSRPTEPQKREKTDHVDAGRGRSLVALAGKARILERLLAGDERELATEIREGLEMLAGPGAVVIPIRR